ncbi:hypothetical protein LTR08_001413 [Meristemomyces frigidus]|nr:hypothetical protein LTR08_001413 [Meristemomyces frigidus]
MALPTRAEYPSAVKELFHPDRIQVAMNNMCQGTNRAAQANADFSERQDPRTNRKHRIKVCTLKYEVPGVCQESAIGEGESKQTARQAAYLHVLAKLHADGSLNHLFRAPAAAKTAPTPKQPPTATAMDAARPTVQGLHDVQYWQNHMDMPTKAAYPHASVELFDPLRMPSGMLNLTRKTGLSMTTDVDYSNKRVSKMLVCHVCDLTLDLPDMCQETGFGEGLTKQAAKQAAWVHVMGKLHAAGILKELLSNTRPEPGHVDVGGMKVEPVTLDAQTLAEEKDAKTEIYNYAARLGQVPRFEEQLVKPKAPRPSFRKAQPKKAKPLVTVTISIPELQLEASGAGKDLRTAEIAAAVAFKRMAEEQHADIQSFGGLPEPSMLNTDSAKDFFVFLKSVKSQLNVEVENEGHTAITGSGVTRQSARLTINGEPTGETVFMNTKKAATPIAYLTAAIEITRAEPELLTQFHQRLRKGKGKVLVPVSAIDFPLDTESLHIMREALIEARQAGLPDTSELLSAADEMTHEAPRRQRRQLTPSEVEHVSKDLSARQKAYDEHPALEELRSKKAGLPMNQYRSQVADMVSGSAYSIVVGATGSGKTTQVPQILLEEHIASGTGGACNIICTQPRRIAATSVAQRVAIERNEPLRKSVGYHVRFEAKTPEPGGSITYCTTGILLEQLKHDPDMLDSVSHLIIDEVHERDLNIDFLMIVIKKALQARRAASRNVPKVILMSATLDTQLFAKYFAHKDENGEVQQCPSISVPGRTFPVKDKYLGDIMHELLQSVGPELGKVLDMDLCSQDFLKSETAFSSKYSKSSPAVLDDSVIDWKRERPAPLESTDDSGNAQQEKEEAMVPTALLAATIAHICKTTDDGAILAFMPGLDEIVKTERHLTDRNIAGLNFRDSTKFKICLLHSSIPKEDQAQIFEPVPPGCRKIILSTNIAETSVTVTDVKHVVDTGKLRETRYDQVRRITKLQCVWESKSNSKQRAGRAGRVQNGYYYALFSKERHDSLRAVGLPELLRSDLQETCLSIKAQKFNQSAEEPVEVFLGQAIEPPPPRAIQAAIANLSAIEAFTEDERLTDLGRLLARLPVHPTLGKMIVLGVVFRCLDPMLVFGAGANERSLFISPMGREAREAATNTRRSYADTESSDHLAMYKAFSEVRNLRDQYGMHAAFDRGRESFIHMGAFRTIDQTARQIVDILTECGLIPREYERGKRSSEYGPSSLNRNSGNSALVQSLLLAGVFPNLGAKTSAKGSAFRTSTEQGVVIHPSSLNDDNKRRNVQDKHQYGTLLAFSALAKSNDGGSLFMRDTTIVTPLMSALFGGKLEMSASYRLEMDDWLPFFVQASDRKFATKLVLEFRKALDRVLNSAFRSLADSGAQRRTAYFADDPMREQFASRVVQILDQSTERKFMRW